VPAEAALGTIVKAAPLERAVPASPGCIERDSFDLEGLHRERDRGFRKLTRIYVESA
jgi:hypothetical protein